jgi:hypothetical protein
VSGLLAALSAYLAGLSDRERDMNKRVISGGLMAAVLLSGLTACSSESRGTGDAPVAQRKGDDSPASVTNFPDGFANIATKCVAGAVGYRAFVTTRVAAPVILPDPSCK